MMTTEKSKARYRGFRKLPFYAGSLHWQYGDLTPGCHIMFAETYADGSATSHMGRVLGIATHNGAGELYKPSRKNPTLAVLVPNAELSFAYIRHVPKLRVTALIKPGAFARWFLFGMVPGPELVNDVCDYGAMSNDHLAEYLTAPEGELRADWHEVAMRRKAKAF